MYRETNHIPKSEVPGGDEKRRVLFVFIGRKVVTKLKSTAEDKNRQIGKTMT